MQSSIKLLHVIFNLSLFSVRDTTFLMKGSKDELHVAGQFQMSVNLSFCSSILRPFLNLCLW